jgi:hypothetical protein
MIACNVGYGPWCRDCAIAPACTVKASPNLRKMIFDEAAQELIHCECLVDPQLDLNLIGEIQIDTGNPRIAYYNPCLVSRGFAERDFVVQMGNQGIDCAGFIRKRKGTA